MTQPVPTLAYVESKGGKYWGTFAWPLNKVEEAEFWAFKTPAGQLRHDHFVTANRVTVYSLPYLMEKSA